MPALASPSNNNNNNLMQSSLKQDSILDDSVFRVKPSILVENGRGPGVGSYQPGLEDSTNTAANYALAAGAMRGETRGGARGQVTFESTTLALQSSGLNPSWLHSSTP